VSRRRVTANDEPERMWKEDVVAYFMILSQHLNGAREESHESLRLASSESKFEHGTF
jgi:hypothetical protein